MPRPPWRLRIAFMAIVTAFLALVGAAVPVGQLVSATAAPITAPSQSAIMQAAYPSVKIELVTAPSLYKFTFDAPAGLPSGLKGLVDSYWVTVANATGTHSMKSGLSKSGQTVSTLMADFGPGTNTISAQTTFKVASAGSSTTLSSATPAYPITPGSHAAGTLPSGGSDTGSGGVVSPVSRNGKCPSFQVFALRGSRGSQQDTSDSDTETASFASRFKSKTPGMQVTFVHYDAIPVGYGLTDYGVKYIASVATGTSAISKAVTDFTKACNTTPFGVVGYSQGAHVASNELTWLAAFHPDTFKWMVVFGNPLHNRDQPGLDAIPNGGHRDGVMGSPLVGGRELLLRVLPDYFGKFRSFCLKNDPVCDYTSTMIVKCIRHGDACPHAMYLDQGWIKKGADWALSKQ